MKKDEVLALELNNIRVFSNQKWSIPYTNLLICDQNGSGKTSLLSSIYTLYTGTAWPNQKLAQYITTSSQYAGIRATENWYWSGDLSTNRLSKKYVREDRPGDTRVMSYTPNDNLWLNQSRSNKIATLDNAIKEITDKTHASNLSKLTKAVASKNRLLKRHSEDGFWDQTLTNSINKQIMELSIAITSSRINFLNFLDANFEDFVKTLDLNYNSHTITLITRQDRIENSINNINKIAEYYNSLDIEHIQNTEKLATRCLWGAQRDDFQILINSSKVEETLSRGEMRMLITWIKLQARNYLRTIDPDSRVIWLLDDIFNEFDQKREQELINKISKDDIVWATGTKPVDHPRLKTLSLNDLKKN